jgi:diguanylate cyclase (GGDEF)-like protein
VASGAASGIASAHEWVQNQQAIARILANTVAVALANVKLREALRQQSIRDPLTGLFNRRYMEETLVRELRRAQRTGQEVTVLLLDIDHFKHFNDTFGHPAGDELLKGVSAALQSGVRAEDVVCRFGGEEFVIILFGAGCDVGQMRAEGFRECIKRLDVRYQGAALGTVSVSIGIAGFPTDGSESGSLIDAADRALYHAKAGGRDRVELARDAERTTVETALIAGE